ncbi:MAG: hypothetical protein ISR84_00840 [Kiritimatiellales bacterium]|nr:hypothetical protein [Kiritimatiellales bacterium]
MEKIVVSICTEKTCYTAGATLFKQLSTLLGAKMKSQVLITGTDQAWVTNPALAPCVKVDGRLIMRATPGDVINAIRDCLQAKPGLTAMPVRRAA